MYNNWTRCQWCQLIANEGEWIVYDKLILHKNPILQQTKSCLELYKLYCKFVKEKCE